MAQCPNCVQQLLGCDCDMRSEAKRSLPRWDPQPVVGSAHDPLSALYRTRGLSPK